MLFAPTTITTAGCIITISFAVMSPKTSGMIYAAMAIIVAKRALPLLYLLLLIVLQALLNLLILLCSPIALNANVKTVKAIMLYMLILNINKMAISNIPVSYTHLDVYKRQV